MNFERTLAKTSHSLLDDDDAAVHRPNGGRDEPMADQLRESASIATGWFFATPVVLLF